MTAPKAPPLIGDLARFNAGSPGGWQLCTARACADSWRCLAGAAGAGGLERADAAVARRA